MAAKGIKIRKTRQGKSFGKDLNRLSPLSNYLPKLGWQLKRKNKYEKRTIK